MKDNRNIPTVFVSSTCYDLSQVREDLKDFFEDNYGFTAMLSEFDSFPIDPCKGTFENCLSNVDNAADIFILIIGNRYGYVTDKGKSITNLEYLHAKEKKIPIYVFVNKQIQNTLFLWKANKEGDFSSIVDNPKIFEFVDSIYNENNQWIYTYDSVRDIKQTMKNQLRLLFFDGLKFQKEIVNSNEILNMDIPAGAARALIEKPYEWEYKFFAHVLKYEFDKLKSDKWDLKYGILGDTYTIEEIAPFMDDVRNKLNEMIKITDMLKTLVNHTMQDAIGKPGEASDLEMMIYTSKTLAMQYKRLISWSLYYKSIKVDDVFQRLIDLLHETPISVLTRLDEFVDDFYKKITELLDVDDGKERNLTLQCVLDVGNTDVVNEELLNLSKILLGRI